MRTPQLTMCTCCARRWNPSEGAQCLKISGHVKQVLNIVEDCKAIQHVGKLVQFSGIPEDFARTTKPSFKAYATDGKLMVEGINAVPVAAFLIEEHYEEEYPGLYSYVTENQDDMANKYAELHELAAMWGFEVEGA